MTKEEIDSIVGTMHYFPTADNPVYIKKMQLKAGLFADTHAHNYDHWSVLVGGKAEVLVGDIRTVYSGPEIILIRAGEKHKITALSDITWLCIHHVSHEHIENIDEVLIRRS